MGAAIGSKVGMIKTSHAVWRVQHVGFIYCGYFERAVKLVADRIAARTSDDTDRSLPLVLHVCRGR